MLTNEKIEQFAVNSVSEVIAKAPQLQPQFNTGDKIPLWDGEISVYRSTSFSNANYMTSIPVQIKGTMKQAIPGELSYPVEINYLRAFAKKERPTLFFVVTMNEIGEDRTIFYRALHKADWDSLTLRQRNQNTVTMPFILFPTEPESVNRQIVDLAGGMLPDMPPIPMPLPTENVFLYDADVMGFFGRDKEWASLRGFLNDPRGFLWWGIAAPGGTGKSRLAYEFMNALNNEGKWTARFLKPKDYDQLDRLVDESPVPLLLISDYAQLHAAPLGKWMESRTQEAYNMPTLRLLLLDRDDGEEYGEYPWEKLLYWEGDERHLRNARYDKIMPLGKIDDKYLRELIRDFADALHQRDEDLLPLPDGKETELLNKLHDIDEGLCRPLFALILTDAYLRDPTAESWSREKLLENLVEREKVQLQHAIRSLKGANRSDDALEALCLRLKCVATALGTTGDLTLSQMESACVEDWETLKDKAGQYNYATPDELLQHLGLLAIRGEELFVPALRPDLLGEYLVLHFLKHCGRLERSRRNLFFRGILSADVYPKTFYQRLFRDYRYFLNANPSLLEKLMPSGLALNDKQAATYSALLMDGSGAAPDLASRERILGLMEALLPRIRDESCASIIYNNLGMIYTRMGRYDQAQSYHKRSLEIDEKNQDMEHPEVATSFNNLGMALRGKGDFNGAMVYVERALAIREKRLGSEHPDVAQSCSNLGVVLHDKGDLDGAMVYYLRALTIREKRLGSEHPDVAYSYSNLGTLLCEKGDFDGAVAYHKHALAIREKHLGLDHPDVATSCNNLGQVLYSKKDYEGASVYYERALVIREKQLGPNHPDVATSCNNLGTVLHSKGDLDGAIAYFERALAIREIQLGSDHPSVATSCENLGTVLYIKGDLDEAIAYLKRALSIKEKQLGLEHPNVAYSCNNLGMALRGKGDFDGAMAYLKRAQTIWKKHFDANHPNVKTVRENIEYVSNLQAKRRQ